MNNKTIHLTRWFDYLALIGILFFGAFLRFYRMRDYLVFLGDEGRDVLVVKKILIDHIFTLLGPVTSVGGMYLGPIYYYLITPFLWVFQFDPVGPAIMVGCFGVATIYFVYRIGRDFFDPLTGLISAFLYATAPLVVNYSRSSWNPNVVPFFACLIIYGLLHYSIHKKILWLGIVGLCFGVIIQLHYLALLFLPLIIFWIWFINRHRWRTLLIFIVCAMVTFSPFLLFELKHSFPNTRTISQFITRGGSGATFSFKFALSSFLSLPVTMMSQLIILVGDQWSRIALFILTVFYAKYFFLGEKDAVKRRSVTLLLLWLFTFMLGYSLYRGAIYEYYFVPVFPLPFLLLGLVLSFLSSRFRRAGPVMVGLVLVLFSVNFVSHSVHLREPNRLLKQTQTIAEFVLSVAHNKPFNFALISSGNSDHAYRYFFEVMGNKPVVIENPTIDQERRSVTDQLIVICEDKNCQPLGNSLWEVAGFGAADVTDQWDIITVKIFKMQRLKG